MIEMSRSFTHLVIPSGIWLRRDICMQAKCLWAELHSLHSKDAGGCYASEDYLCDFLQLKRRRLYELLAELKNAGLVETVSFDGRRTVRCAIVPEVEYKVCGKVHSSSAEKCTPPVQDSALPTYIESKEKSKDKKNTLPTLASEDAASPRKGVEFSPEVKEVGAKMVSLLREANPVYRPPQDINVLLKHVALLLERDKQEPADILDVFQWAVNDNEERGDFKGWQSVLSGKNPIEKFRKHFATLHAQMRSRPKRKFAPSSDDKKAYEALMSMDTII